MIRTTLSLAGALAVVAVAAACSEEPTLPGGNGQDTIPDDTIPTDTSGTDSSGTDTTGTGGTPPIHPDSIIDMSQYLDLSPRSWPDGELDLYWNYHSNPASAKQGSGTGVMITGTTGPVAIRSGYEALLKGGSAADAVLTTALSQITLAAGSWVSYAGRMTAAYYDAATGQVHTMNANYNVPLNETSPLSIPGEGTPSGRSALVPGFMAGVQSFHDMFGQLEWPAIFSPAIYLAEEGFVLRTDVSNLISSRRDVLGRLPETRAVFTRDDGTWYGTGDLFKQELLGRTLRYVAAEGAGYMYSGPWGQKLIAALSAEGGVMTMQDLTRYEADWSTAATSQFGDYTVHALNPPNAAGPIINMAMELVNQSGLDTLGSYTESADVLYGLMQIGMVPYIIRTPSALASLKSAVPGLQATAEGMSPEDARLLWDFIQSREWVQYKASVGLQSPGPASPHSDAVIAIDAQGNMAAILHTINAIAWGTTGIFVDGVSIPNSAAIQRNSVAAAGPGGRVSDLGPPLVVTRDGQAILASSATGGGNATVSWQILYSILGGGMSPKEAVDEPNWGPFNTVQSGDFDQSVIDGVVGLGQPINFGSVPTGFWTGIRLDPSTGMREGAVVRWLNGIVID